MYPSRPSNTKQKTVAALVVIAVITLISGGVHAYEHRKIGQSDITAQVSSPKTAGPASSNSTPVTTEAPSTSTSTASSSGYKDGTYTASSNYFVPHGSESIKVTLTVQGGIVTDSKVTNSESDPESASYQEDFASSYKSHVIGKKLNAIQLSYVAGASDTTQGFNDALSKIESQAQA